MKTWRFVVGGAAAALLGAVLVRLAAPTCFGQDKKTEAAKGGAAGPEVVGGLAGGE